MNKELIINVTPSEIAIALFEDKQLVELNKEKCKTGYSVGDIYLGKVKKIMPGLNAAFVNIGYEKDAFIHYLDLGPQFTSLHKLVGTLTSGKRAPLFQNIRLDKAMGKTGKISGFIASGQPILAQIAKEAISTKTGMLLGFLLRKQKLSGIHKVITVLIWLLLFLLGIDVGGNQKIINGLHTIGLEAIVITLAAVLGSVTAAWALWYVLYKRNKEGQV